MGKTQEQSDREKKIAEKLKIFHLSEDSVRRISVSMEEYVRLHLCPPIKHPDPITIQGLNPEQIQQIRQFITEIFEGIEQFKNDIFWERLALEILVADPHAFTRMCRGDGQPPIQ